MVKIFFISLFTCLLCFCSCSKRTVASDERTTYNKLYKVKKIKEVNDWYFIYFHRNDSVFMVVSHKPSDTNAVEKYPQIKKRGQYDLTLISLKDYLDGVWVPGFFGYIDLDSKTSVHLEPGDGIDMIYLTSDLDGLYYLKDVNSHPKN